MAMMRRDGREYFSRLGVENNRNGEGRGGDGGQKLFRSSKKNLDGGGISVRMSSISTWSTYHLQNIQEKMHLSLYTLQNTNTFPMIDRL